MKSIHYSFIINKSKEIVWNLIGTKEGTERFFSPDINVAFEVGGEYEILFDMEQEEGLRGSEGMKVLCLEPMKRLGFTWNAPPTIPDLRGQQTAVFIELQSLEENKTSVSFSHCGFGNDKDWVSCYSYFVKAWGQIVLPRLIYAAEMDVNAFEHEEDLSPYLDRIV